MTGYVTEKSLTPASYYSLESFPTNRLDQLLTTLCSLKDLNFDTADFYLDFDLDYVDFRIVVEKQIEDLFAEKSIRIFSTRLDCFDAWKTASLRIPPSASCVLLKSNLDHAYVANGPKHFQRYLEIFESLEDSALASITHWQEYLTELGVQSFSHSSSNEILFRKKVKSPIGTILVKRDFFQSWWDEDFTQGLKIVRPDNPFGPSVTFHKETWQYVYSCELFRHLDGYGHIGVTSKYASALRACCTFSNGQVAHYSWSRGMTKSELADLPLDKSISFTEFFLNLNSRYFSPWISWQLRPRVSFSTIILFKTMFHQLIANGVFRKTILRTIAQKYLRSHKWKYNLLTYYTSLSQRVSFIPAYSRIRSFFRGELP